MLEHECIFYERIFVADHGPVVGYEKKDNMAEPKIQISSQDIEVYNYMCGFQQKFTDVFKEIIIAYKKTYFMPCDLYNLMIENALWRTCVDFPKIWKIKKRANELTKENFGNMDDKLDKKKDWKKVIKHNVKKNPFVTTDFSVRILEDMHLRVFLPLCELYCRIEFLIKKQKVERVKE